MAPTAGPRPQAPLDNSSTDNTAVVDLDGLQHLPGLTQAVNVDVWGPSSTPEAVLSLRGRSCENAAHLASLKKVVELAAEINVIPTASQIGTTTTHEQAPDLSSSDIEQLLSTLQATSYAQPAVIIQLLDNLLVACSNRALPDSQAVTLMGYCMRLIKADDNIGLQSLATFALLWLVCHCKSPARSFITSLDPLVLAYWGEVCLFKGPFFRCAAIQALIAAWHTQQDRSHLAAQLGEMLEVSIPMLTRCSVLAAQLMMQLMQSCDRMHDASRKKQLVAIICNRPSVFKQLKQLLWTYEPSSAAATGLQDVARQRAQAALGLLQHVFDSCPAAQSQQLEHHLQSVARKWASMLGLTIDEQDKDTIALLQQMCVMSKPPAGLQQQRQQPQGATVQVTPDPAKPAKSPATIDNPQQSITRARAAVVSETDVSKGPAVITETVEAGAIPPPPPPPPPQNEDIAARAAVAVQMKKRVTWSTQLTTELKATVQLQPLPKPTPQDHGNGAGAAEASLVDKPPTWNPKMSTLSNAGAPQPSPFPPTAPLGNAASRCKPIVTARKVPQPSSAAAAAALVNKASNRAAIARPSARGAAPLPARSPAALKPALPHGSATVKHQANLVKAPRSRNDGLPPLHSRVKAVKRLLLSSKEQLRAAAASTRLISEVKLLWGINNLRARLVAAKLFGLLAQLKIGQAALYKPDCLVNPLLDFVTGPHAAAAATPDLFTAATDALQHTLCHSQQACQDVQTYFTNGSIAPDSASRPGHPLSRLVAGSGTRDAKGRSLLGLLHMLLKVGNNALMMEQLARVAGREVGQLVAALPEPQLLQMLQMLPVPEQEGGLGESGAVAVAVSQLLQMVRLMEAHASDDLWERAVGDPGLVSKLGKWITCGQQQAALAAAGHTMPANGGRNAKKQKLRSQSPGFDPPPSHTVSERSRPDQGRAQQIPDKHSVALVSPPDSGLTE
eukprot:gene7789-7987_t